VIISCSFQDRFRPEFDTAPSIEPDALDSALDAHANPARTEFTF